MKWLRNITAGLSIDEQIMSSIYIGCHAIVVFSVAGGVLAFLRGVQDAITRMVLG